MQTWHYHLLRFCTACWWVRQEGSRASCPHHQAADVAQVLKVGDGVGRRAAQHGVSLEHQHALGVNLGSRGRGSGDRGEVGTGQPMLCSAAALPGGRSPFERSRACRLTRHPFSGLKRAGAGPWPGLPCQSGGATCRPGCQLLPVRPARRAPCACLPTLFQNSLGLLSSAL